MRHIITRTSCTRANYVQIVPSIVMIKYAERYYTSASSATVCFTTVLPHNLIEPVLVECTALFLAWIANSPSAFSPVSRNRFSAKFPVIIN